MKDNLIIVAILIAGVVLTGGILLALRGSGDDNKVAQDNSDLSLTIPQTAESPTTQAVFNNKKDMSTKQYSSPPAMTIDTSKNYSAVLTTSKGNITINLFASETPITVNNFVFLSREGFYDNTRFHRIIKGFMIQGGDPEGNGTGGPGYKFEDEPVTRDYDKGIVAMANSGPNTNGSQFFIMHANYPLPKDYVIFGQVTDEASLAVVDAIADTPVKPSLSGENSVPTEDVIIQSVSIKK